MNASESAGSEAIQPLDRVGDHLIRLEVDPNSIETIAKEIADGRVFVGANEEKVQRVDGEITRLPASTWSRDNDTEIWEWTGYRNQPEMIELAKDIAESKRAVIRFNGQQFHDDHVISSKEKSVIYDMLLAWEAMKP